MVTGFSALPPADRRDDAEYRFFLGWKPPQPPLAPTIEDRPAPVARGSRNRAEIVGLFPTPGARS